MANNDNRGFNTVSDSNVSRRDQRVRLQRMTVMAIIAIAALMAITVLVLVIGAIVSNAPSSSGQGNTAGGKVVLTTQTVTAQDTVKGDLVVVNKTFQYSFPEDKSYLSKVYSVAAAHANYYKQGDVEYLETETLNAIDRMLVAMATETGYTKATIATGYRSFEAQESIGSSTKGGYSDHHTGRLCTLNVSNDDAKAWLNANAHKYGFVVRYPDEKSEVTGVSNYSNAYRYVGVAHATYMVNNNLCLEEYVDYLAANVTDKKPLSVTGADGNAYDVYYYTVSSSASVKVPTNYVYTVSGTNKGGVVVTVFRSVAAQEADTAESAAVTDEE